MLNAVAVDGVGTSPGRVSEMQPARHDDPEPVAAPRMEPEGVALTSAADTGTGAADSSASTSMPPPMDMLATGPTQPAAPSPNQQVGTDAVDLQGPLLVYTAAFVLGVYEVEQTQDAIVERVQSLGGFLQRRTSDELLLRIPVRNFSAALEGVEAAGDVIARQVESADVGEEFRDVATRIQNAEAMRERLEALLARASSVTDALEIERELGRITEELERLKGRQRYLSNRIQLSTLSVRFHPLSDEPVQRAPEEFELPFPWLRQIGLTTLMRLR